MSSDSLTEEMLMLRFLRGLEEMHVPKPVKAELGGGKKEFSLAEGLTGWQSQ